MDKQARKSDFTQGGMLARILEIAAPMTLALLINVLYNVVDRIYIGHMPGDGKLALTGIGLAFPITVMISAFQSLCSSGGAPIFSIARGRGDRGEADRAQGNAYMMLAVMGAALMALAYAFKEPMLRLIGANHETFAYANDYLDVYLLGTLFVMTSLGMNPFINAQGAARTGMCTVLIGAIINIALDPLFIYTFGMGVKGAALASIIAQGCSCAWVHVYLLGKKAEYPLRLSAMRPDGKLIGRIIGLGLTGFTAQVTNSAVTMVYNAELAAMGGTIWVSAMTVVSSAREIIMMAVNGLTGGAQPVLGYNYGAGRTDRVRAGIRIITVAAVIYQAVIWALIMLFPGIFVGMFTSDQELLIRGMEGMRLFFCMTVFFAFMIAGQSVFVALGKSRQAVFFSLLRKAVLVIPLSLLLPRIGNLGVKGVFLSEPVSDVIGGCACYITMLLTVWRRLPKNAAEPKGPAE